MTAEFVRDRITLLRIQKGVSEYKMNYDLGHSRGYIYNISSGRALPSMEEFFAICEYFGITHIDFFDADISNPKLTKDTLDGLKKLSDKDLCLVQQIINRLLEK